MSDISRLVGGHSGGPGSTTAELEDWEKVDPNLLNNPELLYRECEKLPLPDVPTGEEIDAYLEKRNMLWQLFHDEYSDFLDVLESEDPLPPDTEGQLDITYQLLETVRAFFSKEKLKIENFFEQCQNKSIWLDEDIESVFSEETIAQVMKWKSSLTEFLETYIKIRQFIPPGTIEESQETEEMKNQKEQLRRLPNLVEQLDELISSLNLDEKDEDDDDDRGV